MASNSSPDPTLYTLMGVALTVGVWVVGFFLKRFFVDVDSSRDKGSKNSAEIADLKVHVANKVGELKVEIHKEVAEVREAVSKQVSEAKGSMLAHLEEIKRGQADLRVQMVKHEAITETMNQKVEYTNRAVDDTLKDQRERLRLVETDLEQTKGKVKVVEETVVKIGKVIWKKDK